jgi:hypothetical protein
VSTAPSFFGSFGPDYERPVSKAKAVALNGGRPLPGMGRQMQVALGGDVCLATWRPRLLLSNVSGVYFLRSHNCPCAEWTATFGVDGLEPSVQAIAQIRSNPPSDQVEFSRSLSTELMLP